MKNHISPLKFRQLLGTNLVLAVVLGIMLLFTLRDTQKAFEKAKDTAMQNKEVRAAEPAKMPIKVLSKQDSIVADSLKKVLQTLKDKEANTGVTFDCIILLMLIAGGLGGILCNLRGFFMHYRDNEFFPKHLEIPYYVRPFMGAGAGLFVYFVSNFLITSITTEYLATNIPFQGMVSFIALAILAGFGSLEFFQRLKETALTLFGQKLEKDRWQKIEDLYGLMKKGVITEEEFKAEKKELLDNSSDIETSRAMMKTVKPKD